MSTTVNPMRRPRVGGIAGGCGTSIVAALIGGEDLGVIGEGTDVDVLVCRSVASHLTQTTAAAAAMSRPPVVVVSADAPSKAPGVVTNRARMLEPHVPAVLWLGWIEPARAMSDPVDGVREAVLTTPTPPAFARTFAFRQRLIDQLIELLTATIPVASDSVHDNPPLRQTS